MSRAVRIIVAAVAAAGLAFTAVELSGSGPADVEAHTPPNGTCIFCA